jgi:hypothetical protein
LRLLFNVYIEDVKDISSIDINSDKIQKVFQFVIIDDLESYMLYYPGLMKKIFAEAKRENTMEKEREKV